MPSSDCSSTGSVGYSRDMTPLSPWGFARRVTPSEQKHPITPRAPRTDPELERAVVEGVNPDGSPHPPAFPYLERVPGQGGGIRYRVHFDADQVFAVYDVKIDEDHQITKYGLGSRHADCRVFRPMRGRPYWLYAFAAGELHRPDPLDMWRQFRSAMPFTPFPQYRRRER